MEQELQQRSKTTVKTHEEIMKIMGELKAYEEKYKEYELSEIAVPGKIEEALVEFEPVGPEFLDAESSDTNLKDKFTRRRHKRTMQELEKPVEPEAKQSKAKPTQDTVFKLRFDETGNLGMLGAKKHPVKQTKPETKGAKKLSFRRKNKTESEPKEEKSRLSKLKGGAGKIKNIIPGRKKKEKTEEIKKRETPKYE
jgi:hypothetical protein